MHVDEFHACMCATHPGDFPLVPQQLPFQLARSRTVYRGSAVSARSGNHAAGGVVAQIQHLIGVWSKGVHACASARLPLPNTAIDTACDDPITSVAEVRATYLRHITEMR